MDRDSRIPKFDGSDYAYWKTRMRAYLKGKGADIWAIINATSYSTDSAVQSHHDANNKALDILLSSLSRNEFDRVCDLELLTRYGLTFKAFMKEPMPSRQGFLRPISVSMKISFNFLARVSKLSFLDSNLV